MKADEVRRALDLLKNANTTRLEKALVTEGLKVLDDYAEVKVEYEKALKASDEDDYREFILRGVKAGEQQINLIAVILRSAGRIS